MKRRRQSGDKVSYGVTDNLPDKSIIISRSIGKNGGIKQLSATGALPGIK
jgi:hypothetical protein